jgi:hypothetical protein
MSGIFISHHSCINDKMNYQIETHNDNIIVYLSNCEYCVENIQCAMDIIDSLQKKIHEMHKTNIFYIDKPTVEEINIEFQLFLSKKANIKASVDDFSKNLMKQIEDIRFDGLESFIYSKVQNAKKVGLFVCDLCNTYTSSKLKGISAHKRGCKKLIVLTK